LSPYASKAKTNGHFPVGQSPEKGRWILDAYEVLNEHFGPLHWWPGDSPLEIVVGAILTQNTAWPNVEKAIAALKQHRVLSVEALLEIPEATLAALIRPSGYYNLKARRLKSFFSCLQEDFCGSLEALLAEEAGPLREKLLSIKGIGAETADSILLYAGGKRIFVVDAYTRRLLIRHDIIGARASYEEIQGLFMNILPADIALYNQYHALIVNTGKRYCRKAPLCPACPLYSLSPPQHIDLTREKGIVSRETGRIPRRESKRRQRVP